MILFLMFTVRNIRQEKKKKIFSFGFESIETNENNYKEFIWEIDKYKIITWLLYFEQKRLRKKKKAKWNTHTQTDDGVLTIRQTEIVCC